MGNNRLLLIIAATLSLPPAKTAPGLDGDGRRGPWDPSGRREGLGVSKGRGERENFRGRREEAWRDERIGRRGAERWDDESGGSGGRGEERDRGYSREQWLRDKHTGHPGERWKGRGEIGIMGKRWGRRERENVGRRGGYELTGRDWGHRGERPEGPERSSFGRRGDFPVRSRFSRGGSRGVWGDKDVTFSATGEVLYCSVKKGKLEVESRDLEELLRVCNGDEHGTSAERTAQGFHKLKTFRQASGLYTDPVLADEILFVLTKNAKKRIQDFKPRHLGMMLNAYIAQHKLLDSELVHCLQKQVIAVVEDFKASEVPNFMWAVAKLVPSPTSLLPPSLVFS